MSDKTIKHFIFSRFFTFKDDRYPYDIYDVDFLSKQLILANNMLRSLENQTNKNFELVFLTNARFFDNPKYEFIFSTLKESTTLSLKFIRKVDVPNLVQEAYDNYDFVVTTRMDFDDFVFKDAVADTQSKVDDCENISAYGYCIGYEYINGELYIFGNNWGEVGHHSIFQSLTLKSSFARNMPFVWVYDFGHSRIKLRLKEFVEANGITFSENMFQQALSKKSYIYFRHECSHYNWTRHEGSSNFNLRKRRRHLTNEDGLTKKQLEDEFGFFHELNSIK